MRSSETTKAPAPERGALGVEIKKANHLKMPFTLSHADAIIGYLIQKTFMKLPNGGGRR